MPTMWPTTLKLVAKILASPSAVIDGALELIIEGVREQTLNARARRAPLDIARIRQMAAGDPIVERLPSAAFLAMATSMRRQSSYDTVDRLPAN
eukprot:4970787-Pleurochrysis_carterae.AAC.2